MLHGTLHELRHLHHLVLVHPYLLCAAAIVGVAVDLLLLRGLVRLVRR